MKISVVLCTYNRSSYLDPSLSSLAELTLPPGVSWEVVVVDNNSTDQTRGVVEGFIHRYPGRFRYVFESHQGLSHARNAGIRAAEGEIIAFTDDDVTLEPGWLQSLTAPLLAGNWAGVGGRILPKWRTAPPSWLALKGPDAFLLGVLPVFDRGPEPGPLVHAPFGANMAFRKEAFQRFGGFRTDLGRSAGSLMSNEDTEFGRRLLAAGEQLYYEPSAVVHHPVTDSRLRKKYFLAWWFDYGRAEVREAPAAYGISKPYFNLLKMATVGMLKRILRWMPARDSQRRFAFKTKVWMTAGEIVELYRISRTGPRFRSGKIEKRGSNTSASRAQST